MPEEFVTLPNLSPKEQSNCAKFLASLKKKEPLIEGWWLSGKIHLETLTRLDQTTWFNDELMDYCFENMNSLFGGDCRETVVPTPHSFFRATSYQDSWTMVT